MNGRVCVTDRLLPPALCHRIPHLTRGLPLSTTEKRFFCSRIQMQRQMIAPATTIDLSSYFWHVIGKSDAQCMHTSFCSFLPLLLLPLCRRRWHSCLSAQRLPKKRTSKIPQQQSTMNVVLDQEAEITFPFGRLVSEPWIHLLSTPPFSPSFGDRSLQSRKWSMMGQNSALILHRHTSCTSE